MNSDCKTCGLIRCGLFGCGLFGCGPLVDSSRERSCPGLHARIKGVITFQHTPLIITSCMLLDVLQSLHHAVAQSCMQRCAESLGENVRQLLRCCDPLHLDLIALDELLHEMILRVDMFCSVVCNIILTHVNRCLIVAVNHRREARDLRAVRVSDGKETCSEDPR